MIEYQMNTTRELSGIQLNTSITKFHGTKFLESQRSTRDVISLAPLGISRLIHVAQQAIHDGENHVGLQNRHRQPRDRYQIKPHRDLLRKPSAAVYWYALIIEWGGGDE